MPLAAGSGESQVIIGMEPQIAMPLIGVTLSLGDVYYDLSFDTVQK